MAGNTLTIGARFKPMSYAEMIAPVQGANIEYKAQQEELDKLNQASSVWENMANKETDPLAYQKYTNFSNTLKQQADALASQGLSPNSRKAISQMKGQYQSDILPIEQAYKQRAQMADYYSKARAQNPTLMSNIDPSKLSLDKLIANPSLTPEYYSGNLLAEQVSSQAKTLASQLRETGQWKSTAGGQMLERIEKYGLSPKDVQLVQSGQGPKELQDLVNNVIKSSPIGSWENAQELLPKAYQYAASGLYAGIGKEDVKTGQDQSYITPELRYRMKKDAEAAAVAKAKLDAANKSRPASWESLNSQVDATKSGQTQGMKANIDFLKTLQTGNNYTTMLKPENNKPAPALYGRETKVMTTFGNEENRTNIEKYNALVKKYGTRNPTELINKLNQDIKHTTSEYRQTAIKAKDNSNLNSFLLGQLSTQGEDALRDLVKTEDGKKLKVEEIRSAFGKAGRLKYNAETKELGILNPEAKHFNYKIDKSAVRSVTIPILDNAGNRLGQLNGKDYLEYVDRQYKQDPSSSYINTLMSTFYDAMDSYGNQFMQSAPDSNAKAIVNEIE